MKIYQLPYNDFQVNTYIVAADNGECAVIDPACYSPQENEHFLKFVKEHQLNPVCILLTHPHIDHVLGVNFVHSTFGIPIKMHKDGIALYKDAPSHGLVFGFKTDSPVMPETFIVDNEWIMVGEINIRALYTPGHAPGSLCFYLPQSGVLFSGDVLFQDSIGRTDLPGGSFELLMDSIHSRLLTLPHDTIVYPGHGYETSIGEESSSNPYLV